MEAAARGLIVGSHNRDEVVLIYNHGELWEKPKGISDDGQSNGQVCSLCGDEVGVTEEGEAFVGCNDCAFPICRVCYEYERREGAQVCPQCKTRFKRLKGSARVAGDDDDEEDDDDDLDDLENDPSQDLPVHGHGRAAWKKRLERWKSRQRQLHRSKGERGSKDIDDVDVDDNDGSSEKGPADSPLMDEGRLPLSRKLAISTSQLNPYRMVIIIRCIVLVFFFHYRILHPVNDAYALWLVSVICEIWFAVSWILDQFPKWLPVNRETYLDRLSSRYENWNEGESWELPPVDIFVSKVEEGPISALVTANTILSILAVDYPVEKVSCYICDDGASMLTFQVLSATCDFARKWVPFCKKFDIEPRAPEWYFSEKMDYLKDKVFPQFIKERRAIKREYEEFKVGINVLVAKSQKVPDEGWKMQDGTSWPGNDVQDHPGMIQVFLGETGGDGIKGKDLPCLVYVCREKRPAFHHHKKAGAMNALVRVSGVLRNAPYILNLDCDHYVNNSKALREAMCFMMTGKNVCYVQFPLQMVDGDYSNRDNVFFNINMKGLDGIQGPTYMGSGCVFRRFAFYGSKRPDDQICNCWPHHWHCLSSRKKKKLQIQNQKRAPVEEETTQLLENEKSHKLLEKIFGQSPLFIASALVEGGNVEIEGGSTSLLSEAIHVIGCGYEEKTDWGKEVGWMYGSTTAEDMLTGYRMHCRGWRSVYCVPPRPAFRGTTRPNRLHEALCHAFGSVEIFLSRHCPLWHGYGNGLKWLQRVFYIGSTLRPFTSIPLVAYCTLPAVCLLTEKFITPEVDTVGSMLFASLFVCVFATCMLETRWSGVGLGEWWRNQQFWMIGGVSSHLFAVFQGLLKAAAGVDTVGGSRDMVMLIPPTTILVVNVVGVVGGMSNAFSKSYESFGPVLGRLLFGVWVIAHLYPFVKREGRARARDRGMPTVVVVWSVLVASIFAFLWVRIDPFLATQGDSPPALQDCGLECI